MLSCHRGRDLARSVFFAITLSTAISAHAQAPYSWTISASSSDPYVNTASPSGPLATYYVWFLCTGDPELGGAQVAHFGITTGNPDLPILAVYPNVPWLNAGTLGCLYLATICQTGPSLAATVIVLNPNLVPFSLCIEPCLGEKETVDCDPSPQIHPMDWIGLDVGAGFCGKGEPCTPNQPYGACCLPDGQCGIVPESTCALIGGEFQGEFTNCAEVSCASPPGACCFPDETCLDGLSLNQCQAMGGSFYSGASCSTAPCTSPPQGACCFPDGGCVFVPEGDCAVFGGQFQGEGVACKEIDCEVPIGQEPLSWGRIKAQYR